MGLPQHDLDKYLDWQQRLESQIASGLSVDVFCLQEGVSRATFYRWVARLREGIPEPLAAEEAAGGQTETAPPMFLPLSLKTSTVEIQLPNGTVVRLPLRFGQEAIVEVIRMVGTLHLGKAAN
jgi:transposase-like protein